MRINIVFLVFTLCVSCSKPIPRKPIEPRPSTIVLGSNVTKNKALNEIENRKIAQLIAADSLHIYKVGSNGFWYTYIKMIEENSPVPTKGNEVVIEYDIQDLEGRVIYSKEELGLKKYKIDQEDFIPGLQEGIKLMKLGEKVTFVIPSYSAFGISGDGYRIGINQSIKSTVTLINIK